jgi:eukaryotic-like serine/threonine-protein kinase
MVLFKLPDRYQDKGERFEGGQGYVSVFNDTYLDRSVAVKYMKNVAHADVLMKELSALCDLSSRHVAQVYDLISSRKGTVALIQEYVPGNDLQGYIATKHADLEYFKTLWQLACGLEDIHAQNRVHRDIKPSNVKFDDEGILKILDFGLVSQLPTDDETIDARGTRHYLAPELYDPPPVKVTPAIDVYAFGVTAWYLLGGGVLPKSLRQIPPQSASAPPSFSTASVPPPNTIVATLDRTLRVDPTRRPSISTVRETLEGHLLFGRHILTLSAGNNKSILNAPGATATLRANAAVLTIRYDGLSFLIDVAQGDVFVNNAAAVVGDSIPRSCVVTFGLSGGPSSRTFVSANISKPEVVL